ncbi:hypothetical protein ERO13_A06G023466v2 [Gossypium hirsutum]|nr:hypothetical protein ERO13_A06G023466v2 [Gossypium hirsutum]
MPRVPTPNTGGGHSGVGGSVRRVGRGGQGGGVRVATGQRRACVRGGEAAAATKHEARVFLFG